MSRPSGLSNKRQRPIPCDYEKTIADVTLLARKRAISLLDKCLNNHRLNATEQRDLIIDVSRSFGLGVASHDVRNGDNAESDHNPHQGKQRTSNRIGTNSAKEIVAGKKEDDHNEVCEVCEKGGDLLCCDTCSLVFHLGCIRPKISSIPKGKWSCAYCTSDGVGTGDGVSAKRAIIMMGRLGRGLESEDEAEDCSIVTKGNRMGEIMIVRSGKRFIVRKVAHSQIIELGRYDNLDDALGSIKPVYRKLPTVSNNSANDGETVTVTTPMGALEDDDLWCTHCMDDPAVAVCAFCGCRTCFGKHNSEYLLLCDYCDQESHTYCLSPKLTEIPEDAWYCGSCINLGFVKTEVTSLPSVLEVKVEEESIKDINNQILLPDLPNHIIHRVKGRPGRPKKILLGIPEDFVPAVRVPKVAGRGRGRPPGSGRGVGMNEDGIVIKQSLKGSISGPMRFKSNFKLNLSNSELNGISQYPQSIFGTTLIAGAGVKAILSILENNDGKRTFWPSEKQMLNQMKEWSPLEDLQIVHTALILQKDLLLQRIRNYEPNFIEPVSSAKNIRNATLLTSKESPTIYNKNITNKKSITSKGKNNTIPFVKEQIIVDQLVLDDDIILDIGVDFSLLDDDIIEDLGLDEGLMTGDIKNDFLDCGDNLISGSNEGEENERKEVIRLVNDSIINPDNMDCKMEDGEESKMEDGDEDEESKMEDGDEDEESKMEDGDEDEESKMEDGDEDEESKMGDGDDDEESKMEDGDESDDGDVVNDCDREGVDCDDDSKEDQEGDDVEEEDEGVNNFDFQDAGMIKQDNGDDDNYDAGDGDDQPEGEEDSIFDDELSEVADRDS